MNKNTSIEDVFEFINTYELETTTIWGGFYQSHMPSDSIPYIEDRIRGKSYMDIGFHISSIVWVNREPPEIIVFPRLMNMNDKANQEDWLHTMQHLQLESLVTSYEIVIRVPVGEEKQWASEFEKSEIVKGTRLFYPIDYVGENKKEIIGQIPY